MNSTYTTHLICAPQLEGSATIGALLVTPGTYVDADAPLVLLHCNGLALDVCAPEAGIVGDITVVQNESVAPGDLLLTMEIEEKPFGFLPMVEEEPAFAPACQQVFPAQAPVSARSGAPLQIDPQAASLAARLGVDLADVRPDSDGVVDEESVAAHVRDILVRWRKLRRLVAD